jgi:hypothetical protein
VKPDVTVILNLYRRPEYLRAQIMALEYQTQPVQIMVWHNVDSSTVGLRDQFANALRNYSGWRDFGPYPTVIGNANWGVWPRFLFGMEAETEFVMVMDDDVLPGRNWVCNCLDTFRKRERLIVGGGYIFPHGTRRPHDRYGVFNPRNHAVEVDIGIHCWFFPRDWLRYFALEPRCGTRTCGEEYHMSVVVQKQLGLGTWVPPFPIRDLCSWCETDPQRGRDAKALWRDPAQAALKDAAHQDYLDGGWRPLCWRRSSR